MSIFKFLKKPKYQKNIESSGNIESIVSNVSIQTNKETKNEIMEEKRNEQSQNPTTGGVKVYNLIILDQSGSMQSIYNPALSGVNETLQTIRMAKGEHPEQDHTVTLVAFDGLPQEGLRYNSIYNNTPAEKVNNITSDQYRPYGNTPLFDAMGRAINELRDVVGNEDVVLVTIITDGYENASREYSSVAIKALVEEMRKKGWVFTYIGANQDVDKVAESMAINNRMSFSSTNEGTQEMFAKERMARNKFFTKITNRSTMSKEDFENDFFTDV